MQPVAVVQTRPMTRSTILCRIVFIVFDDDPQVPLVLEAWDKLETGVEPKRVWTGADLAEAIAECAPDDIVIVMTHGGVIRREFTMGKATSAEALCYDDVPELTCRTLYSFACLQDPDRTPWTRRGYDLLAMTEIAYAPDIVALLGAVVRAADPSDAQAVLASANVQDPGWTVYPSLS